MPEYGEQSWEAKTADKVSRWPRYVVVATVAGMALLCCGIGVAIATAIGTIKGASNDVNDILHPSSSASISTSASAKPSTTPKVSPTPKKTLNVLISESGRGNHNTRPFKNNKRNVLTYSYDCRNAYAEDFEVYVYKDNELTDIAVSSQDRVHTNTTTNLYGDSDNGDYYLKISTLCTWKVQVTAVN